MSKYVHVSLDPSSSSVMRIVDALESIASSLEVIADKKKEIEPIKVRTIDGIQRIVR
jgi:hypothetical protein